MIVELVGLPGSGKSTFAKKLAEEKGWHIVHTTGAFDILLENICFLFRHPLFFFRGFIGLLRYRGASVFWYTKFVNLFLVHNATYMKASRIPRAIIDQGHYQNIISLFDEKESTLVLHAYLSTLPPPDVLLVFAVDPETRIARLQKRGYSAREDISPSLREAWEVSREENFELLYGMRAELPCTTIVVTPESEAIVLSEMSSLRLWRFLMRLRMPTEKAHGLQIAKTLEALAGVGERVELWLPRRQNKIENDLFSYYGLTCAFPVRQLSSLDMIRYAKIFRQAAFWLDALAFLITLFVMRIDKEAIYYTRNAEVAWVLKRKDTRVFYEAHWWPSSKHWLFSFLLRGVDGIVANSEGTARAFRDHGFAHTTVIRNGADLEKFAISLSHPEARKEVALPLTGNIIMYVGSFARWKGVATLCRAWAIIRRTDPFAFLVLVGGTMEELLRFDGCAHIASDSRMIILPHQRAPQIPIYLRAANILVLPNEPITVESIKFTSPIKLFEYMASGRPIVASDLPAMREVLDETTASFFTAGNHEDLARSIATLLAKSELGEHHAIKARDLAKEYSWKKRAERLIAFVAPMKK